MRCFRSCSPESSKHRRDERCTEEAEPVDPLRMVIVRDMWTGRTNYLGK